MDLKILSTGSNREIVDNITDYLKNQIEYDITKCDNEREAIRENASGIKPNVVILCLGTEDEESVKLYDVIAQEVKASHTAVVVVASREIFDLFTEHTALSNLHFVPRPVSRSSIFYKLEDIKELFDSGELGAAPSQDDTENNGGEGEETEAAEKEVLTCAAPETAQEGDALSTAPRKRILIVDDDAEQLAHIKGALQEYYLVTAVRSGVAAFKYLENHSTDLILLDYKMPGMDGPSVLTQLRGIPAYKDLPVVFLTGVSEKETIIKTVVRLKPQGYLVKPAKKSEIIAKIIDILG